MASSNFKRNKRSHKPLRIVLAFLVPSITPQKVLKVETKIYVGNLSKLTTLQELNALFSQAGDITATDLIEDRKTGKPQGFAFITMSAQSEADKAVNMFNSYLLRDQVLKVSLARPRRPQRDTISPVFEP